MGGLIYLGIIGGKWIRLKHNLTTADGYQLHSYYLHLENVASELDNGTVVNKDQILGRLGATGIMKGYTPHLHLELRLKQIQGLNSCTVDPSLVYFETGNSEFWTHTKINQGIYKNLTRKIRGDRVPEKLAKVINGLTPEDRRFLRLYIERWEHLSRGGKQPYTTLLKHIMYQS